MAGRAPPATIAAMSERTNGCRRRRRRSTAPEGVVVTDEELLELARAFERARGRQPTIGELRQIDAWARRTRANALLLPMVLRGLLRLDLDERGEPVFLPPEDD
jgi:hypothetical protein